MSTANKYNALAFYGFIIILLSECCIISNSITQAAALPRATGDRRQNSHVVFTRYVRRRPPTFPGEEEVFEVRETHYGPHAQLRPNYGYGYIHRRPKQVLKYRLNDEELDRRIRCDFEPTLPECETLKKQAATTEASTNVVKTTSTTTEAPTTTTTTTTTEKSTTTEAATTTTTEESSTTEEASTTTAAEELNTTTTTDLPLLPEIEFTSEEKIDTATATDAESEVIGDLDDDDVEEDNVDTETYNEENEVNADDEDADTDAVAEEDDDEDELIDVNEDYKDEDVGAMGFLDTFG